MFVRDFAREIQFLFEAFQGIGIAHKSFPHNLDGNDTIDILVVSLVDATHSALAEKRFNAISSPKIAPRRKNRGSYDLDGFRRIHSGHGGAAVRTRSGRVRIHGATLRTIHSRSRQTGSRSGGQSRIIQQPEHPRNYKLVGDHAGRVNASTCFDA